MPLRPALFAATLILVGALAGCADRAPASGPGPGDGAPPVPFLADPDGMRFTVPVGPTLMQISALVWPAPGATTAVVLVHGHSGVKENYFHTAPELGASFGARIAGTGRTAIAIDLPGYGGSDGDPNAVPFDLMAEAVRGVAGLARAGDQGLDPHDAVVAYGLSMGAIIVNVAASGSTALDAVIPAGFPLTPYTEAGYACTQAPSCEAAARLYVDEFFRANTDLAVANATTAGYETDHDVNYPGYLAWVGDCVPPVTPLPVPRVCAAGGRGAVVAADVAVPVFTWVGDHDLPWLGTDLSEEASFYPAAPRVDTWVMPDAGHFVHNHRSQPVQVARLDAWLVDLGL